jgi:hypothetical protein
MMIEFPPEAPGDPEGAGCTRRKANKPPPNLPFIPRPAHLFGLRGSKSAMPWQG